MYRRIIDFFRTDPPVYQKSSRAFWDDEHISKGMLAAHLDVDSDGASRKLSTIRKSADWICHLCQRPAHQRLLDLGCGVGLYSELLYDGGFSVTGIDLSRRSIACAQNRADKTGRTIKYRCQNYLELDDKNAFDAAILIYCDFGVLSPIDRNVLLAKIHRALQPGGVLILDVFNRPHLDAFQELQAVKYENGGFWSPKPHVLLQKNRIYRETDNILERYLVITEDDCACFNIWNQIYSQQSFCQEVENSGFETAGIFDDVCGSPFTGRADVLCGVFLRK